MRVSEPAPERSEPSAPLPRSHERSERRLASGLEITELRIGSGARARDHSQVLVHYRGTFPDGTEFDSSRERQPFRATLGKRMLIRGFERGIVGMREGGLRRVTVPPELGYGERGAGERVPPNAVLVFEIELLEVVQP